MARQNFSSIYPLVSIVIPCYNSKDIFKNCLKSVLKTKYPNFEVIVVDDYSTDGTYDLLYKEYGKNPKIRIARNEENSGPSITRNRGIKLAKGEYVAFIETDMEVDSNWLDLPIKKLEGDFSIGAVQTKTLDLNRKDRMHSMGVKYNPHTFWVISLGMGAKKDWQPSDGEMGMGSVGSIVRKKLLDKIGGYDEKLVHNVDDLDFAWRIWLAGYRIVTSPESITYHWTAKPQNIRTQVTSNLKSEFHFHKNSRILIKNYELVNVFRFLPWLFCAYSIRVIKNLAEGDIVPLKAFFKAIVWSFINLPDTLKERERIQKLRKRDDEEMFKLVCFPGSFFNFYFNFLNPNLLRVNQVFVHEKENEVFCPVCGEVIINDKKYILKATASFNYKICSFCNQGIIDPLLSRNDLDKLYKDKKYFIDLSAPVKNKIIQWLFSIRIYQTSWEWVKEKLESGKILDIGCGNGEFLDYLKKNGWNCWGIDISDVAVKNTALKIGRDKVRRCDLLNLYFNTKFDYVSFWHALEHSSEPVKYLKKTNTLLKEGGKILGEVPNFDSPLLRIFQDSYSWIMVPDHVIYFSEKSLKKALKIAGFKDILVYYPPRAILNFSFSLSKSIKKATDSKLLFVAALIISAPFSILLGWILSLFGKGEVLRFIATK